MSEPSETSGRLLAPTSKQEQHPTANATNSPSSTPSKHRKSSQPSDETGEAIKPTKSRRRPGTTIKASPGSLAGSSRSKQRSTTSPTNMMSQASINYTRTGRISKAKKGLKVHNCECGRSYTRAEHLRRHKKNHAEDDALLCDYPGCGKPFYRLDLLQRHREKHNESGNNGQISRESSQEAPPSSVSVETPSISTVEPPQSTPTYYPSQPVVPDMHQQPTIARYTSNLFRTPQLPRTPRLSSSGSIALSPPSSRQNPKHHHISYARGMRTSVPVQLDNMSTSFSWSQESLGYSPAYSSPSSGYTSPNIAPGEFGNFYPHIPYGPGFDRTRTPSNASLHEQWSFPQSPSSSISTMPHTWASNEKMPTASLAYINTSYPMASLGVSAAIDSAAGYMPFDHKTMMQRDEDEAAFLFRDQPYGMGQPAHTYPSEQFLNNYWRLFHPTFPVVHRFSFENMSSSPLLRAAMVAIDGQYSNDMSMKKTSRLLHDRCIKLLAKREREPMQESDRACDHQAVFLIEVLSQYRARRAAKMLTPRFGTLYHKMAENFRYTTSQLTSITSSLAEPENQTLSNWIRWIELGIWQRLLASCYILESQQAMLLAREPAPSLFQGTGMDLPFPMHTSVWDAISLDEWTMAAQQYSSLPQYVFGATPGSLLVSCDVFQSSLLIAASYNHFDVTLPYSNTYSVEEVDTLLDNSFGTKQSLLTAKLLQVTPLRELLAVSGESWILSEKVSSPQSFTAFKTTLRTWAAQLWSSPTPVAIHSALKLSFEILTMALTSPSPLSLGMGTDMGVYFAGLVLWAITTAASTRSKSTQQALHFRHNSLSPTYSTPTSAPNPSFDMADACYSEPTSPVQPDSSTTLLSYDQISYQSRSFLPLILGLAQQQSMPDLSTLQAGCISMLLWVKLQLRGASALDDAGDMAVWASAPGAGLGELLDGVVGCLERVLNRGWVGWGI